MIGYYSGNVESQWVIFKSFIDNSETLSGRYRKTSPTMSCNSFIYIYEELVLIWPVDSYKMYFIENWDMIKKLEV